MKVGLLPKEKIEFYRPLLLPDVADAIADGASIVALIVSLDKKAFGAVAAYLGKNRVQIVSLYVAPGYRRRGAGRLLIQNLIDISRELAFGMEINFTSTDEEHQTLFPFLKSMGFKNELENEKTLYITTIGEMVEFLQPKEYKCKVGVPFSELDDYILNATTKKALARYDQLPVGGLSAEHVDRDVSLAVIKNDEITSYIVIDTLWPDTVTLSGVRFDDSNPQEMMGLMRSSLAKLHEKYAPETKFAVHVVKDEGVAIMHKLLPEQMERISFTYYYTFNK